MTSRAIEQSTDTRDVPRRIVHYIGLMLAILMLVAYVVLPFANQPELGALTITEITADRDFNPLEIPTEGVIFIPIMAAAALAIGIWGLIRPYMIRNVGFLTAICGIMSLLYPAVFFKEYFEDQLTYLDQMGVGFWAVIVLGVLMILQYFWPRPTVDEKFTPRRLLGNQEGVILIGLVVLIFLVGLSNPRFLAERNITDVLSGNAYIAVAAIGMSMVIITGNIDISVGSLVGLLAAISGQLIINDAPVWVAWTVPILVGMAVEAFIGFLVAYMRIPSIVVTLGMLSIIKGGLILWTNGERIINLPQEFFLAQMRPLGIPMPIWFMVILTILAGYWMRYSNMGRSFYALGGNAEAARLSGFSQKRIIMNVFIINGFFVGVASVLYATQLNVIQTTPPPALELSIITASVVGGVSILGGTGTILGSTLATLLLNFIRSAMIFINVSPFWLRAVQGVLILITVLADLIRRRRQKL